MDYPFQQKRLRIYSKPFLCLFFCHEFHKFSLINFLIESNIKNLEFVVIREIRGKKFNLLCTEIFLIPLICGKKNYFNRTLHSKSISET